MDFRRYSAGTYVSAAGHTALLFWLLFGWGLNNEPMDFDITEVSVVSGAEYDAIVAASTPQATTEEPAPMAPPVVDDTLPEPTPAEEAPQQSQPDVPAAPVEETPPPEPPSRPEPPAQIAEDVPVLPAPPAPPAAAPDLPPTDRPVPRPAERVASEATPPPPPEAEIAPDAQQEVAEDAEVVLPEPVEEEQSAAAPEESTTEIVTEAETPAGAVQSSPRPPSRPNRPTPQPVQTAETEPEEEPEPARQQTEDEAAALAAALAAASTPTETTAPAGPPLTGGEQEAFRLSVQSCWNVDTGAEWANVVVTVGFNLSREGQVIGEIKMLNSSGGTSAQANTAFQAARRAVLRCQSSGYNLPAEKYDSWKEVEITFDPSQMVYR